MQTVTFIAKKHLATNIWEFRFTKPTLEYIPGQYARFLFPFHIDDPRKQHRTFTLISHPTDDVIAFMARIPEPCSVYKQQLMSLKTGDEMLVEEARGDVILPRSSATPLTFVAGGIGIASYMSMLREIALSGQPRDVSLLYALHSESDRIFGSFLADFPFATYESFISPKHITPDDILLPNGPTRLYYLSGTEKFVESLRHQLEARGLDHSRIVFDYFTGY